jgi:membrane-associated phospholipid phosphatase
LRETLTFQSIDTVQSRLEEERVTKPIAQTIWCRVGDVGRLGLVATAVLIPLWRRDRRGAATAGLAIAMSAVGSKLAKEAFPKRRPDGEDCESFPSQHSAEVFAAATSVTLAGQSGLSTFAPAVLTGLSRWPAGRHYPSDIASGVALGIASAWLARAMIPTGSARAEASA